MDEPNLQTIPKPITFTTTVSKRPVDKNNANEDEDGVRCTQAAFCHEDDAIDADGTINGGLGLKGGKTIGGAGGQELDGVSASGNHRVHHSNMRSAFAAAAGKVILSADYRQLEFRLMAHFSVRPCFSVFALLC